MHRVISILFWVLLGLALSACGRAGGQPFQPALNTPLALPAGQTLGQTLNPPDDIITGLDLSVATFGAPADPGGVLTVTVRPAGQAGVTSEAVVPGTAITDGAWVDATFDPPVRSDGVVVAEIRWDGDTPLALWADVPLEDTRGITNDPYPEGQLVIDGRPVEGDLAFRVSGPGGIGAAATQVQRVLRAAGSRLVDQPEFLAVWLAALSASVLLAVRGLGEARGGRATTPRQPARPTEP